MLSITQAIAEDKQDQRRNFSRPSSDEEEENRADAPQDTKSTETSDEAKRDDIISTSFSTQSMIRLLEDLLYQRLESIEPSKQQRSPWLTGTVINDNAARNTRARQAVNAYSKTAKNTIKTTNRLHTPTKIEPTPKELYQALLRLRVMQKNGETTMELDTTQHDLMAAILSKTGATT